MDSASNRCTTRLLHLAQFSERHPAPLPCLCHRPKENCSPAGARNAPNRTFQKRERDMDQVLLRFPATLGPCL